MNGILLLETTMCDADSETVITYIVNEEKVFFISI